jgi:hypothetical protein
MRYGALALSELGRDLSTVRIKTAETELRTIRYLLERKVRLAGCQDGRTPDFHPFSHEYLRTIESPAHIGGACFLSCQEAA